ncbi:thioredoxin-like [Gambusia affinis]|uniref:thioredoxin-like n=1 Tax=Gambusia affinis TaxID=33528 RepID=UPI001CDD668C|nr:thioredoxin-like [Gambusia affinis]
MIPFVENLADFDRILSLQDNKLVVVEFTARYYPNCQTIEPLYEALAEDPENKDMIFLKVDVNNGDEVAEKCRIKALPTFQFYIDEKKVDEFSGANGLRLRDKIERVREIYCSPFQI